MSFKSKVLASAGVLTLAALSLGAGTSAWASSPGCAFTNGCATLHGMDASGNDVAMDAKRQDKNGIVIGYPDNAGDVASSWDGVLHYGKGSKSTTYQDTSIQANFTHPACGTTPEPGAMSVVSPVVTGTAGDTLSVRSVPAGVTYTISGVTVTFAGLPSSGAIVVDESYGSCTVADLITVSGGNLTGPHATLDGGGTIHSTYPVGGVQFTGTTTGGSFSYSGLPAGITSNSSGMLTVATSTQEPGTYSSVGVTFTDTNGASVTDAFQLVVKGDKIVTPGAGVAYYTFVYAPKGDWTSQCVTDINGSGALRLFPCTLGKDTGQDFTIDSTSGLLDGSQHHVSNWLAAAGGVKSCLVDPSTSAAATSQSDAADELPPGGRQLYVNGSCAANVDLWSWGT